jgi:hypothetical protein
MRRWARWGIVLGGIVVWAGLVALLPESIPTWVRWALAYVSAVALAGTVRRFVGLDAERTSPGREPGSSQIAVISWGPRAIEVVKAIREEQESPSATILLDAMHREESLTVFSGLSRDSARDVAAVLEARGATVAIDDAES